MDLEIGAFIFLLLYAAALATPVLVLVYRQGRKDRIIEELQRDVDGIGKKCSDVRRDYDSTIATLSERIDKKLEGIRSDYDGSIGELRSKVDKMNETLVEVNTSVKFLAESLKPRQGD